MSRADEQPIAGPVPLWEVPGWREKFGVVAGITGRGDSSDPFDLGLWTNRPVGAVMGRWRQFLNAVPGFPSAVLAHQVHGATVLSHEVAAPGWTLVEGADGHVAARPGILLLVTVADCIPIYLVSRRHRAIALLHAGWRGTAAGILARGTELLQQQSGTAPNDIAMHLGVGICGMCYEVGSEVVRGVGRPAEGAGPWHLDLREVLLEQAARLGIAEAETSTLCTACQHHHFFSHRGSRGTDGRMVAYLGLAA